MTMTYKNFSERLNCLNVRFLRKILCFGENSAGNAALVLRHAPKNFLLISDFPTL